MRIASAAAINPGRPPQSKPKIRVPAIFIMSLKRQHLFWITRKYYYRRSFFRTAIENVRETASFGPVA